MVLEWKLSVVLFSQFRSWHMSIWHVSIPTDTQLGFLTWKRKQHPSQGDDTNTVWATPGRVGRDEQGEARRGNTTLNGGPHLELGHLRLKTWSKSGFSIAEIWSTHLYIYEVLTRGAPPRRANARLGSAHARNTEDVLYAVYVKIWTLKMRQYCQGVHWK